MSGNQLEIRNRKLAMFRVVRIRLSIFSGLSTGLGPLDTKAVFVS
jgi:hypothetical protein